MKTVELKGLEGNSGFLSGFIVSISLLITILSVSGSAQEVTVSDFPLGVGIGSGSEFFKPYNSELNQIVDALQNDSLAFAIIIGSADGAKFAANNDAKNPGLALGRALALRNYLVDTFGVDGTRIVIQTEFVDGKGGQNRFAKIRIERGLSKLREYIDDRVQQTIQTASDTVIVENRPPFKENMGIQLGAGFSSSPFGGIPIITGAITWKRVIFIEAILGHTIWNSQYNFDRNDYSTRRREAGALISLFPLSDLPVGLVAGWIRFEEISRKYGAYVRMSEGPVIGLRVSPFDFLSITGMQNTAKLDKAGDIQSRLNNDQFIFSVDLHIVFGGGK